MTETSNATNIGWDEVVQSLSQADNYWLSTTLPDGRPHAVVVGSAWLADAEAGSGVLVFQLQPNVQTVQNLVVQPFAVVHLEDQVFTLIVEGVVELMSATPEAGQAGQAIAAKYNEPVNLSSDTPQLYGLRPNQVQAFRRDGSDQKNIWHWPPIHQVPKPTPPPTAQPPQQPTDPSHPGSNSYPYGAAQVYEDTWEIWHEELGAIWPTKVHLFRPVGDNVSVGKLPVLAVSPGKELGSVSYYRAFLEHICRKGYIVLFVVTEAGILDCQHDRWAGEFLNAINDAMQNHLEGWATKEQIGWWGHSIGSKVVAIAASRVDHPDYLQPTLVIGTAFTNTKAFCNADAYENAAAIPSDIAYTLLPGSDDTIAKTSESLSLFQALPQLKVRQVIQVNGYANDGLVSDHAAPMSNGSIPLTRLHGNVNALDWYGYWKWTVGALDYHFKGGPDDWIYGSKKLDGGTDSAGHQILHSQLD